MCYLIFGGTRGWGNYIARRLHKEHEVWSIQKGECQLNNVMSISCHLLSETQLLEIITTLLQRNKKVDGIFFTVNYSPELSDDVVPFAAILEDLAKITLINPLVFSKALKKFDRLSKNCFAEIVILNDDNYIGQLRFDFGICLRDSLQHFKLFSHSELTLVGREPNNENASAVEKRLKKALTVNETLT